jgi:hypothetical protein
VEETTAASTSRLRRTGWRALVAPLLLLTSGASAVSGVSATAAELLFQNRLVPAPWWQAATLALLVSAMTALVGAGLWKSAPKREVKRTTADAVAFWLAFAIGVTVSADTSWRFFEVKVGVANLVERTMMFAGVEVMLLAAGLAMRNSMATTQRPGRSRYLTWGLCVMSAVAALQLSGWPIGPARVLFGPILAVIALHYALGVELRDASTTSAARREAVTMFGRIARELQERLLSRLGLADDARTALQRTRERAADRAARLAIADSGSRFAWLTQRRLRRALRAANIPHDTEMTARVVARLSMERAAGELQNVTTASPWDLVVKGETALQGAARLIEGGNDGQNDDGAGEGGRRTAENLGDSGGVVRAGDAVSGRPDRSGARGEDGVELADGRGGSPEDLFQDGLRVADPEIARIEADHIEGQRNLLRRMSKADAMRYAFDLIGEKDVPTARTFLLERGVQVDRSYGYTIDWSPSPRLRAVGGER